MDFDTIITRHEAMEAARAPWENLWERVAQLYLPMSNEWAGHSPGQRRNRHQYDAFAMGAIDRFDAAIEAGLMPRQTMWHRLSTGVDNLDDDTEVKRYLEGMNRLLWRHRYAPASQFAGQAHEVRQSHALYGTGCMLVEPRRSGGMTYKAIHLSEIFVAANSAGIIDTVHRRFKMTARQAVQTFGDETPERIMRNYETGRHNERHEFIHAVMPREDYEPGRVDDKGKRFRGVYFETEKKEPIREEGYYDQPYIVSRYNVTPGEVYGRGPAVQRLPDVAMLNEMKRVAIDAANLAVNPPSMSSEDFSEYDLLPGTMNPGALDDNGRPRVVPYNNQADPRISMDLMRDVRDQVDDGFLGVYFRVLLENPNMTATQAMLIAQQQGQMTAPAIGRLQAEWLDPLIRRESGILYRQGRHPPIPQRLAEYMSARRQALEIRYESPLTRSARSEEAIALLRTFETLAPLAQIDPSVYAVFDVQEAARLVTEVNGVPASVLKSRDQVAAENEAREAQAAMGAVLDAAPVAAETARTLAEAQSLSGNTPSPIRGFE